MQVFKHEITDRASWLDLRARDVTASDVAAVCGFSPYRTALDVFARKTGLAARDDDATALMKRGLWFESAALTALQERFPDWQIRRCGYYLRAPEIGIGATPDAVVLAPSLPGIGNLQIKVVARRVFNAEWRLDDGEIAVPFYHQLQTLTETKLMGVAWQAVAALVVGEFSAEIELLPLPIHDKAWERIVGEVRYFWRCVEDGRPPEPIPGRDYQTLRNMFLRERADEADPINLAGNNQLAALLAEREGLKASEKASEERVKEIDTLVMAALQDNPKAVLPPWAISWKVEPRKGHTVAPSNPRVLRINRRKDLERNG